MARKFITTREYDFIKSINKELIQNFIGQEVLYYAISREDTNVDDLYGESIEKSFLPPVMLNCLVSYDNPVVKSLDVGLDTEYTLDVYALTDEMNERNLLAREGDFVEFGQVFFEITGVTKPQLVFGHVNNKLMTKLTCVASREAQFAAGSYSDYGGQDNSHPILPPQPRNIRG